MSNETEDFNIKEWYTAQEAADRLSRNSGKEISVSYPRKLAQYNKIRSYKISERVSLYRKEDVDTYIVEERGEKSARAKRQAAKPKKASKSAA